MLLMCQAGPDEIFGDKWENGRPRMELQWRQDASFAVWKRMREFPEGAGCVRLR